MPVRVWLVYDNQEGNAERLFLDHKAARRHRFTFGGELREAQGWFPGERTPSDTVVRPAGGLMVHLRRADLSVDDGTDDPGMMGQVEIGSRLRLRQRVREMLGLVPSLLSKGILSPVEVERLRDWCRKNPRGSMPWPEKRILQRLVAIVERGLVEEDERSSLQALHLELKRGEATAEFGLAIPRVMPLDMPSPDLEFENKRFVLTGWFAFGPWHDCERAVEARGGISQVGVRNSTDVLVIGSFASADWAESFSGTKIGRALELKRQGYPIGIVSEEHWTAFL